MSTRWLGGSATDIYKGTGFLVGPRHVLTNHHVVGGEDGFDVNVLLNLDPPGFSFQVYPGRAGDAIFNGGAWDVERVVWGPNAWNGLYWGGEDYALVILEDDPDRSGVLGQMGMCSPSNSTLAGLAVQTAGYPGARFQCANSPIAGPDGCDCRGWMYTQACNVLEQNLVAEEFGHDCLTNQGQSGVRCGSRSAKRALQCVRLGSTQAQRVDKIGRSDSTRPPWTSSGRPSASRAQISRPHLRSATSFGAPTV